MAATARLLTSLFRSSPVAATRPSFFRALLNALSAPSV